MSANNRKPRPYSLLYRARSIIIKLTAVAGNDAFLSICRAPPRDRVLTEHCPFPASILLRFRDPIPHRIKRINIFRNFGISSFEYINDELAWSRDETEKNIQQSRKYSTESKIFKVLLHGSDARIVAVFRKRSRWLMRSSLLRGDRLRIDIRHSFKFINE